MFLKKAENEHSCMEKQEDDSPSKKKNIVREARNLSERVHTDTHNIYYVFKSAYDILIYLV